MSFYSLKPDFNPVCDIVAAKDTYVLLADTKICFKINPMLGAQLKNASAHVQYLG